MVRGAAEALLRASPSPSFSLTLFLSLSLSLSPRSLGVYTARAMCLRRRLFESAPYIRRLHHVVTYYSATPCRRRTRASLAHAYTCTYYYTRVCDRALARCKRTRDSAAAGKASTTRAPREHHTGTMRAICVHTARATTTSQDRMPPEPFV